MALSTVSVLDSSTELIPATTGRYSVIALQNDGTVDVRLALGGETPTSTLGITLEANGGQLIFTDSTNPAALALAKNGINAISGTTGQSVIVNYY